MEGLSYVVAVFTIGRHGQVADGPRWGLGVGGWGNVTFTCVPKDPFTRANVTFTCVPKDPFTHAYTFTPGL